MASRCWSIGEVFSLAGDEVLVRAMEKSGKRTSLRRLLSCTALMILRLRRLFALRGIWFWERTPNTPFHAGIPTYGSLLE